MLGYTRVMFSDLCRLCATNHYAEKVHIFQEQGKKLQLQTKIESLIPCKVNESDNLPKVICRKCLLTLEDFYTFRNACIMSETMLSTCFKKAPKSEDFLQTGKVYIKNSPATEVDGKKYLILTRNKDEKNMIPVETMQVDETCKFKEHRPKTKLIGTSPAKAVVMPPAKIQIKQLKIIKGQQTQTNAIRQQQLNTQQAQAQPQLIIDTPEHPPPSTSVVTTMNALKMYKCKTCDKLFKRREHLYQHNKLHTGARPFTCEYCFKSFMRKEHLHRHLASHTGQKNFTCEVCSKSFSRNDNLLKHRKTHGKASQYECLLCNRKFMLKHYFLAHSLNAHQHDVKIEDRTEGSIDIVKIDDINEKVVMEKNDDYEKREEVNGICDYSLNSRRPAIAV